MGMAEDGPDPFAWGPRPEDMGKMGDTNSGWREAISGVRSGKRTNPDLIIQIGGFTAALSALSLGLAFAFVGARP